MSNDRPLLIRTVVAGRIVGEQTLDADAMPSGAIRDAVEHALDAIADPIEAHQATVEIIDTSGRVEPVVIVWDRGAAARLRPS